MSSSAGLIEHIRRDLDAKCSTWGCPETGTLYDDLHPCTEALCRFRDYFTHGATDEQWRELDKEVKAIHGTNWVKLIVKVYRARVPEIPCAGLFYYRGGIHSANKAARLIEKINHELDNVIAADPTTQRNYFLRVEALLRELELIKSRDITPLVVTLCFVALIIALILLLFWLQKTAGGNQRNFFSSAT